MDSSCEDLGGWGDLSTSLLEKQLRLTGSDESVESSTTFGPPLGELGDVAVMRRSIHSHRGSSPSGGIAVVELARAWAYDTPPPEQGPAPGQQPRGGAPARDGPPSRSSDQVPGRQRSECPSQSFDEPAIGEVDDQGVVIAQAGHVQNGDAQHGLDGPWIHIAAVGP